MSLDFSTVLRGVLTVNALVDIDLLKVEFLAVIENGARVVCEETTSFACVLTFVVVVRVDDGLARDMFRLNNGA